MVSTMASLLVAGVHFRTPPPQLAVTEEHAVIGCAPSFFEDALRPEPRLGLDGLRGFSFVCWGSHALRRRYAIWYWANAEEIVCACGTVAQCSDKFLHFYLFISLRFFLGFAVETCSVIVLEFCDTNLLPGLGIRLATHLLLPT